MAVGVESVQHLAQLQEQRLARVLAEEGAGSLRHHTRNKPRRDNEIVGLGSIYWIIKGYIRVRQGIVGFELARGRERRRWALILDPKLVQTELRPHKPVQGWRYLEPEAAPGDLSAALPVEADLPPEMAADLRQLGLL